MSKSLNNFFTIKEILEEFEPEVLRFFLLTTHYRSPLDFSTDKLQEAEVALDRIYTMLDELNYFTPSKKGLKFEQIPNLFKKFEEKFNKAMDDDFNTASALSVMFDYIKEINKLISGKLNKESFETIKSDTEKVFNIIKNVLGIITKTPEEWFKANLPISEKELNNLIQKRAEARREKDFETSDVIRNELEKKGIYLFDTPFGTKYRTKKTHDI
jgi:cysteinyl-tRNA synthetase